jgi:hypothetical protein
MSKRNISMLTAILFALSFGLFVRAYEKHALIQAQTRIETHARIIEDAMWNYKSPRGVGIPGAGGRYRQV